MADLQAQWSARASATQVQSDPCISSVAESYPTGPYKSSNWGGILGQSDGLTISGLVGYYYVTGYKQATCGGSVWDTSWVGIGGSNDDPQGYKALVQAGTATDAGTANYPFAEWITINNNGQMVAGINIDYIGPALNSGDLISPLVLVSSGQSPEVEYSVWDETTNKTYTAASGIEATNGIYYYMPSDTDQTADFIDERIDVNNSYQNLSQWYNGNILWGGGPNEAYATNGGTYDANPFYQDGINNPNWIQMYQTQQMTGALTGESLTGWYDTWKNCSPTT